MTQTKRGIFLHVLTAALLWQTEWICLPHRQSVFSAIWSYRQGTRKASQSSHKTDRKLNFVRWQRENVEYFFMSWQQLCCGKQNGYADHIGKVCFQQYGPIGKEQGKLRNHRIKPIEKSTSSEQLCYGKQWMCFQQYGPRQGTRKAMQSSNKTDREVNFVR